MQNKETKMKKEICKNCGKTEEAHEDLEKTMQHYENLKLMKICKKFKVQGCEDCLVLHSPQNCPKNHSQQEFSSKKGSSIPNINIEPADTHSQLKDSPSGSRAFSDTFNLSEKRKGLRKLFCEEFARYKFSDDKLTAEQRVMMILGLIEQQDKEFIKKLKFKLGVFTNWKEIGKIIDDLVGDDLK